MAKLSQDIPAILEYVRTYGKIDGCTSVTICSKKTVFRALDADSKYYNPDFAAQIRDAFAYYRKTNRPPSENPQIKQSVLEQFHMLVHSGQSNTQDLIYDEHGRVKRKVYQKAGLDKWVYEAVFPPKVMTEQAILFVTSNQLHDLAGANLPEAIKTEMMKWLSSWIQRASQELLKQGLTLKYLESTE